MSVHLSQRLHQITAADSPSGKLLAFWCPGCNRRHAVCVERGSSVGPIWGWNGDAERPTFTPSVLISYTGPDAGSCGAPPATCHTFITDGRIQFLGDCTHSLAGQTVELPAIPGARQ